MRRKQRKLSREDREVWERVTSSLKPLRADKPAAVRPDPPKRPPVPAVPASPPPMFQIPRSMPKPGKPTTRIDLAPDPMQSLAAQPPRIDSKTHQRLSRGKLAPEGRIDLHGMTAERAHSALRAFIMGAHGQGKRLVLVITGKGQGAGEDPFALSARRGVLRNAVPQWLMQPPLAPLVLQIAPAHRRHGGSGAYYVYLRRQR